MIPDTDSRPSPGRRWACAALLVAAGVGCCGCFFQISHPFDPEELRRPTAEGLAGLPARSWVPAALDRLADLLPQSARAAVTGDQLAAGNPNPGDLCGLHGCLPESVGSPFANFSGLLCAAQCGDEVTRDPSLAVKPVVEWPGFSFVEIPVEPGVRLAARFAAQPAARPIAGSGDAVILVHGLFGSLNEYLFRDLAAALRHAGFAVLGLEMRGHGRTEEMRPDVPMMFGLVEPADILAAADWLRAAQGARRIGAVGFSIGGFQCLLAACRDAAERDGTGLRLNGGVVAVSPVVDLAAAIELLSGDPGFFDNPAVYTMQTRTHKRMALYRAPTPSRRLDELIPFEIRRSTRPELFPDRERFFRDVLPTIDFRGPGWARGVRKMESLRCPVLLLHGVNDPVTHAGAVAELAARVRNPNVGVLILPDGGHIGFPVVSAPFYYSLLLNFFDPARGPRAVPTVGGEGPRAAPAN
jgi:predicted alpha/beta-fold hydrolase